jgi:hypothetical protein
MNKIESRLCEYKFNEQEKREIAQELANAIADVRQSEDKLKAAQTQIKAEIETKNGVINLKAENLRSGMEIRSIDCEVVYAYADDVVRWVRCDTGEVAHERKMRPEDRQHKIEEAAELPGM